jgi:hypothetical protein
VTWWKPWTWNRVESLETIREPEYSARDRDLALAQGMNDAEMGPHGIPMSEALDKANQFAFVAEPVVDFAARAIDVAADSRRKTFKDDPNVMAGVSFHVRKVKKAAPPS